MCKEGYCAGLGQEGIAWEGGGGDCLKYPKTRLEQKRGMGKQIF